MHDAIVIGAGPNGLVAANKLADAGWDVLVVEAASVPGGAVRSSELIEPGFINDHCSAFYPLGAGSPVMQSLDLEKFGLAWEHSPLVLAHPSLDGTCPIISRDLSETMSALGADGEPYRKLFELWEGNADELVSALFTPFPPVRSGFKLARKFSAGDLLRFARFALLPVRRLGDENFETPEARRLFAGLALHADLLPESTMSGFFGWLLASLGQSVGFPVPRGGAGEFSGAMVRRLQSRGGRVQCEARVARIVVRRGRAVGVELADGSSISARHAVIADVDAPQLYLDLLDERDVPGSTLRDIKTFEWDNATFKLDWNLDGPIPWTAPDARRAGTVHLAADVNELTVTASELSRGLIPERPFMLFGQQSMTDATRQPEGKETAWAYTHVPMHVVGDAGGSLTGTWSASETEQFTDRLETIVEGLAPGFRDLVRGRSVFTPASLESGNTNLKSGALGGGTGQIHQQLVFRPTVGLGRPETPILGLYLGSSSAHPGGGVHGSCGANAARAALRNRHLAPVSRVARRIARKPSGFP